MDFHEEPGYRCLNTRQSARGGFPLAKAPIVFIMHSPASRFLRASSTFFGYGRPM